MSLNDYISKFIQKENLLASNVKILLAISGGVDSMALLSLMYRAHVKIGVACVNYKLRAQSDDEKALVEQYCNKMGIPFHSYTISEKERTNLKAGNLQSKARDIRYSFFNKIMIEIGYSHLTTAHHQDDRVEGFFLNTIRSTGLLGLTSLVESRGNLLRPLLQFDKMAILQYAEEHNIPYLHDSTNYESDYDRNYIRNEVLPIIKHRFPKYTNSISKTVQNLADSNDLLQYLIFKEIEKNVVLEDDCIIHQNIASLKSIPGSRTLFYYMIKDYGFNPSQVDDILDSERIGALFYSDTHKAVMDRDRLIIRPNALTKSGNVIIHEVGTYQIDEDSKIVISKVDDPKHRGLDTSECFDFDKLHFPLEIRKWKAGDRFCPLGMKGKSKKVKDFLTDCKLSRFDKDKVQVAISNKEIVWVIGHRIDDRYKLRPESSSIVKMEIIKDN